MWGDSQAIPEGMQLLLPIPTGHDMRRLWHDSTWICVPESTLKHIHIPDYQKDFLFWPGIPDFIGDIDYSDFLKTTTLITCRNEQISFNDFYIVNENLFMERETGIIFSRTENGYIFLSIGISEILNVEFCKYYYEYCQGFFRDEDYDNEDIMFEYHRALIPFLVGANDVSILLNSIDAEHAWLQSENCWYGYN
jgi:hypothetical protein